MNWYHTQEEREKFVNWSILKERSLVRFRLIREGSICARSLRIKQETTADEYQNLFDKLVAPLSDLQEKVVEETFMGGLLPWIKAEVEFCEPVGLVQMMRIAQKVENRDIIRGEAKLPGYSGGKYQSYPAVTNKSNTLTTANDNKSSMNIPYENYNTKGSNGRRKLKGRKFEETI